MEVVPNDTADISTVTSESSEVQTASVNRDILSEALNYINFDGNVFVNIHGDKGRRVIRMMLLRNTKREANYTKIRREIESLLQKSEY